MITRSLWIIITAAYREIPITILKELFVRTMDNGMRLIVPIRLLLEHVLTVPIRRRLTQLNQILQVNT